VRFVVVALGVAAVASVCARADTEVGGNIFEDTVWGPDSPTMPDTVYIVVTDVTVENGATLTIEPGVVVRFNEGVSVCCCDGWLIAEGTEAQEEQILFTSNQADPMPGDWSGVHADPAGHVRLSYCTVEYGGGIASDGDISGSDADIHVMDSTIRMSAKSGIDWQYALMNPQDIHIEHCVIEDNRTCGINLFFTNGVATSPVISDCSISRNASQGIICSYSRAASGSPTITRCEIQQSGPHGGKGYGGEGIYCGYTSGASGSPYIADCVCTSNANEGIECHFDGGSGDSTILRCTLSDNNEDGIQCFYHGSGTHGDVHVMDCTMERSAESGIEANHLNGSTGDVWITGCTFSGNHCGESNGHIYVECIDNSSGTATLSRCRFEQSDYYGILMYFTTGSWGDAVIKDCDIVDSTADGMHIWSRDPGGPVNVSIDSCSVSGSGQVGINADGPMNLSLCNTLSAGSTNGVSMTGLSGEMSCCTCPYNTHSGVVVKTSQCSVASSIFAYNGAYGASSVDTSLPEVSYCGFWENGTGDMFGVTEGPGNLFDDPWFVDENGGDYRLACDSPCIDSGDPDTPPVDGTRIDMGAFQFGGVATAPDPEPYGDTALFGDPGGGYPGWVWFSIPFYPCGSAEPPDVLGFACSGHIWRWDKYAKTAEAYQPPFVLWDLTPAESYLLYLPEAVPDPSYAGENPAKPFECRLGRMGWTWVGMPANVAIAGDDFMALVNVKYPSDETGEVRTAQEDYEATPGNWITWSWAFFDTGTQSPKTFTPYAPFGNTDCNPWLGYRVWVRIGTAATEGDPDQVTLIWP
jgi:hypothetical protein